MVKAYMSRDMRFLTMWYVQPAKAQTSLHIRAVWSEPLLVAWIFYECKLLTEQHLEFICLTEGCTGSSGSIHVKMPHCWNHMSRLNYSYVFTDADGSWDNAPISKIHVNNDAELVVWDIRATCYVMTTCSRQTCNSYTSWYWEGWSLRSRSSCRWVKFVILMYMYSKTCLKRPLKRRP